MIKNKCYCGLDQTFQDCCEPMINGVQKATTAESLMRSRYSADATHQVDYLLATTHISQRKHYSKTDILNWAVANEWQKLEIIAFTDNTVEFKAYFGDEYKQNQIHHEFSTFKLENGCWFYVDGQFF